MTIFHQEIDFTDNQGGKYCMSVCHFAEIALKICIGPCWMMTVMVALITENNAHNNVEPWLRNVAVA